VFVFLADFTLRSNNLLTKSPYPSKWIHILFTKTVKTDNRKGW